MSDKKPADIFRSALTVISPTLNTKVVYRIKKHKKLNWNNPTTFVEKLLKLRITDYNHNQLVAKCADKYQVREYLEQHGYGYLLNELIAVQDRPEDVPWETLPDKFAVKLNYASGYNIICADKSQFDAVKATKQLSEWMKEKPWLGYAELQYRNVPKKILVEKFLQGKNGLFPEDYKLYCFHGEPLAVLYMSGREGKQLHAGFFSPEWEYLGKPDKAYLGFNEEEKPEKPQSLNTMLEAAKELSKPFPFVRIDFYDLDGQAVFGEMTFSPAGGFDVSEIPLEGKNMGEYLRLP